MDVVMVVEISVKKFFLFLFIWGLILFLMADHILLEGGQAQDDDHLPEEELHQDECLLHQGTGGVGLQGDGETLLVSSAWSLGESLV